MDPNQTPPMAVGDEPLIDIKTAGHYLGFVGRAVRRHRRLVTMSFLFCTSAGVLAALFLPKVYRISTRILTHRSLVMPALASPDRAVPQAADAPTAGAVERIHSRDNLENIMADVKLQELWESKRGALSLAKERLLKLAHLAPSDAEMEEAYLKMLEERLSASVEGEVVKIDVEWPDPGIAKALSEDAVARFLKMRHDLELSEILGTVDILTRNVEASRLNIEDGLKTMQKLFNRKESELHGRQASASHETSHAKRRFVTMRKPVGAADGDPSADDARRLLAQKQSEMNSLRRAYESRRKKAEDELSALRASLGASHPDVRDAARTLDSLGQPPPELLALQAEEAKLAERVGVMPSRDSGRLTVPSRGEPEQNSFDMVRMAVSDALFEQIEADPEIVTILAELKKRQDNHDDLVHRLAGARIESEIANAAFEFRYKVTLPPIYPKKFVKPNVPLLLLGGALVGLILGCIFAIARDLLSRRILEAWQIDRFIGLRVLGEIEAP